tara:strand:- start:470 stop:670 length:201 start_codon:yes stop_codon:yes gene_type:complete
MRVSSSTLNDGEKNALSFSMFSKQRLKETSSFSSSGEQRSDDNDEVTDGGEDMNVALHFFFFFAHR